MKSTSPWTLYGEPLWISPYVFSSYVALTEKEAPLSVVEVSLADGENLRPAYRDATITAKVPAIEHDGFWLAESSAIAEYLDDVLPAPQYPRLLPAEAHDRARARQLMAWMRSALGALRDERPTTTMFYPTRTKPLSPAGERDAATLLRVAQQVIPPDGGPLFGAWCLADSELAFMLHRLILNGHAVPEGVRTYAEAQWRRPSARGFIEHARPATVPPAYWATSGTPNPEAK
jgi:glutathione S-transferase